MVCFPMLPLVFAVVVVVFNMGPACLDPFPIFLVSRGKQYLIGNGGRTGGREGGREGSEMREVWEREKCVKVTGNRNPVQPQG